MNIVVACVVVGLGYCSQTDVLHSLDKFDVGFARTAPDLINNNRMQFFPKKILVLFPPVRL